LRDAAARLGPPNDLLLAVRSSAVDEDQGGASFAGQYLTLLGVRPGPGLDDAVLRCWASAWSPAAAAYRRARGRKGIAAAPMAVVVQRLVQPRCAGVMFTVNPATGSWRELVVEAAWGQGEAVVSGAVVPELHVVRRPRRTPRPVQRLLARVRLEPLSTTPGQQEHLLRVDPHAARPALVAVPLPAELRGRPCLERAALLGLARLGLRVEGRLGTPADVEWALDAEGTGWVLQARPVTAGADVRRSGPALWTRRFVGERWTAPTTPLGWSLMRELLEWFIAYPETSRRLLGGAPPTRLHRLAPYFNVTVFRHLAFKAPGFPPPRFMVELLPPAEEQGWLRRRAQAPDLRVYASILSETFRERRWQRFRWNLFLNPRAWRALLPQLERGLAELSTPIDRRAEALARTQACMGLAREYVKVHICSLLFANIWFQAAAAALEADGQGAWELDLLSPPEDSLTARVNRDLWRLGRGELSLEELLVAHGHRADGSWELFTPRWREEPAQALELARVAAQGPDPALAAAAGAQRARQALASLAGPTAAVVRLARSYLALREDQRYVFDRITWAWKQAWLWLEADTGLALRYLEQGEVRSLLDGELPRARAEALIARRRAEREEELARRAAGDEPPTFLVGDEEEPADLARGRVLSGTGISPGVATGPARIVRSLADAHRLRPGDILVTRATDPAWTPLFLNARGVVLELGGMLSHGAVLAREYRLPAVVNVAGATSVLQDGQTVTVDGGRGRVWLR
ncbi:hypothetical protein L6R53_21150, partial [Myxococcota bacterium]|nr:hypothetical protein [Myxococcota bacterium]